MTTALSADCLCSRRTAFDKEPHHEPRDKPPWFDDIVRV